LYIKSVTEYSVCGSRAWARARLSDVTPECAIYASSLTSLFRESEQLQNLLSESPNLLRDSYEPGSASRTSCHTINSVNSSEKGVALRYQCDN
jgi:hypothetical protein